MSSIIEKAIEIASYAHDGQYRKFGSKLPYIVHVARVAQDVQNSLLELKVPYDSESMKEMVAASWLHDTIEDYAIPNHLVSNYCDKIRNGCGNNVINLVMELTNPSKWLPEGTLREEKKRVDFEHIEKSSNISKFIKMKDRKDNLKDCRHKDVPKKWLVKYLPESVQLLKKVANEDCQDFKEALLIIEEIKFMHNLVEGDFK